MITNKNNGLNIFEKASLFAGVLFISAFTFVTKQNTENSETITMKQPLKPVVPITDTIPDTVMLKKEKKQVNYPNEPVTKKFPVKKDKVIDNKKINTNKFLPLLKEPKQITSEADAKLQEIVEIKNQIGLKKESIGDKKEQLNTKNEQDKERILKEIEFERNQIEAKRNELKVKRIEWGNLKKMDIRKLGKEENANSKESTHIEKSATININIDPNLFLKTKDIQVEVKKINFQMERFNLDKQEFVYKMNLQQKISPPSKPNPSPEKLKPPRTPVIRIPQ
jgi:hypothetical protein